MTDFEPTDNLDNYSAEDLAQADRLFDDHYDRLLGIARMRRRRARVGDTMSTVDLLHESYLKLRNQQQWASSEHFQRAASLAMRHVIVDYARRRLSEKRGGSSTDLPLDGLEEVIPGFSESPEELVMIADLMGQMAEQRGKWVRIVDARYFAGMTEQETALLFGVSVRTVRREWAAAKSWMAEKLDTRHGDRNRAGRTEST